jgi:ribosomal-protein-alanine N-acetyltransferase
MEAYSRPLRTARLFLRPYEAGDAAPMFQNWAADPEVTKYLTWPPYESLEQVEEWIRYKLIYQAAPRHYGWIIALRGKTIGTIDLVDEFADGGFEIGYCLGRKYWNRGYMSEAFHEVLRFLFGEAGYSFSIMRAEKDNVASRKIIEKEGFAFLFFTDRELTKKKRTAHLAVYRLSQKDFVY